MTTYIALFRGINVGGNNSLPMKTLKEILSSLGCRDIRTYIQSGNAVFRDIASDPGKLSVQIGDAVYERCGFKPRILLLTQSELVNAIEHNPFPTDPGNRLHFYFLAEIPVSPNLNNLEEIQSSTEAYVLDGSVFYLHAPDGIGRSKLAAKVEQFLGVDATARNWNTVKKLMEMIHDIG